MLRCIPSKVFFGDRIVNYDKGRNYYEERIDDGLYFDGGIVDVFAGL